jgi:mono/diheme cytochrome c family protein/sugar lactone lactonase YvrE
MLRRFLLLAALTLPASAADDQPVSFRRDIAPLLVQHCQTCHGPEKAKGGYRIDTFTRLTTPGEHKAAPITPKHPDKSELYRLIATDDEDDRMPQKADPLPAAQVQLVRRWIEEGAAYDAPDPSTPLASIAPPAEHPPAPAVYRQPVPITALAFSPDGKVLAASGYREVTLWDPADGKLIGRIPRLAERTCSIAFSPDGKSLAVAGGAPGRSGEVRLCDVATLTAGKVLDRIADVMLAAEFSPDGRHLAAGGADNAIRLYDARTGERKRLIEQHADWVTALAFSPDSSQLVSASRDKSARVFDVKTGAMHSAFLDHQEPLFAVAWGGDGKTIFSAGLDRRLRAWNVADAKQTAQIAVKVADITRLRIAGDTLLASCGDGALRAYSIGKKELITSTEPGEYAYTIALDPKGECVAIGNHKGEITMCHVAQLRPLTTFVAAPGFEQANH